MDPPPRQEPAEPIPMDLPNNNNTNPNIHQGKTLCHFCSSWKSCIENYFYNRTLNYEAQQAGKIWDSQKKEWVFYTLDKEWEELLQEEEKEVYSKKHKTNEEHPSLSTTATTTRTSSRNVKDTEYYDLLQIPTDANNSAIKKAYYKVARTCHPDKNPNDPQAIQKFQELSHAYNVLSNEQLRANYDKHGKKENNHLEGSIPMDAIDPKIFFNVMFGSQFVEPYIGQLAISEYVDIIMANINLNEAGSGDPTKVDSKQQPYEFITKEQQEQISKEANFKQKKRIIQCAKNIKNRIQEYRESHPMEFQLSCREEATKIVKSTYGDLFCNVIGFTLETVANEYLGYNTTFLGIRGHIARTQQNTSIMNKNLKVIRTGINAYSAGTRAMKAAETLQMESLEQQQQQGDKTSKATPAAAPTTAIPDTKEQQEQNPLHTSSQPKQEKGSMNEAEFANTLEDTLPELLKFAWAINNRDIQTTVTKAVQKILNEGPAHDNTSSDRPNATTTKTTTALEQRILRAKAIQIMGREFRMVGEQYAKSKGGDYFNKNDIKAQISVATTSTMAKAQGQEFTKEDEEEFLKQMTKDQHQHQQQQV